MKIYFGNTTKYSYNQDMSKQELKEVLGEWRTRMVMKNKTEPGRALSFCAGMTLKEAFSDCGIDLSKASVAFAVNGKPGAEGIEFNLSHSGKMALAAVSECSNAIGCDVQRMEKKPINRQVSLAKRFFSVKENKILQDSMQQNEKLFSLLFYLVFSAKEAFIKTTGEGLLRPMNSFEVPLDEEMVTIIASGDVLRIDRKITIDDCYYEFSYFLPDYVKKYLPEDEINSSYVACVCQKKNLIT